MPDPQPEGGKAMSTCPMNLVDSTLLHSIGYNSQTNSLFVKFLKGGLYRYEKVPYEVYDDFQNAPSAGKFFLTKIKNHYPTTKEK
jgi:hypothetical protein